MAQQQIVLAIAGNYNAIRSCKVVVSTYSVKCWVNCVLLVGVRVSIIGTTLHVHQLVCIIISKRITYDNSMLFILLCRCECVVLHTNKRSELFKGIVSTRQREGCSNVPGNSGVHSGRPGVPHCTKSCIAFRLGLLYRCVNQFWLTWNQVQHSVLLSTTIATKLRSCLIEPFVIIRLYAHLVEPSSISL